MDRAALPDGGGSFAGLTGMAWDVNQLDAAYRATAYQVDGPAGRFTLRIGRVSAEADTLLTQHGVSCWAFVTACNPGSVLLPPETNAMRHAHLVAEVAQRGWPSYPGLGVGDDASWHPEVSLFILGVSEADARALGRSFGQNAVVCGDHGDLARLCWIDR